MASTQRTGLLPPLADLAQPTPPYALGPPPRQALDAQRDRAAREPAGAGAAPRISRQHLRETKTHKPPPRANKKIKKKTKSRRRVFPKRNWTPEEDERLRALVKAQPKQFNWSDIARHFTQRVGKQCRERWHNHLSDNLKKTEWTPEEDDLLIRLHSEHGNRWAYLSGYFSGRTDNMIKNRWNTTLCKRVQAKQGEKGSLQSGGSRSSQNSARPSLPEVFKTPIMLAETAADLRPSLAQINVLLQQGPGTVTSLEDHRVDMIPYPGSPDTRGLTGLETKLVGKKTPSHPHLALLSPQFSIRIPVFNRELTDLSCRLLQN